jgi:hypothetical protein
MEDLDRDFPVEKIMGFTFCFQYYLQASLQIDYKLPRQLLFQPGKSSAVD